MAGQKGSILPRWWVAVTLLGVGVVAGVLLVGLIDAGRPDFAASVAAQTAPPSSTSTAAAGQVPVAAEAQVNAACLRVINEAEAVSGVLVGVPGATKDVDLQQLDDLVRRLQPLQPRLQADLRDCRVSTGTGASSAPSAPSSPTSTTNPTTDPTPDPTSSPS